MKVFKLDEDALLVARAKDGSEQDLYLLWQKYQERLYRICRLRLGNELDTEMALGKILEKFLVGFPKFKGRSSFKTYLYTIANNVIVDFLRKRRNDPKMVNIETIADIPAPLPENSLSSELVRETISQLKPISQAVLIYRYYENLSFKEIGKILGKKEATVRKLAQRARQEFYRLFKKFRKEE
ncbi:MAG: RNA polymerase sigma factor [candidate division WOR-3 bacterium]